VRRLRRSVALALGLFASAPAAARADGMGGVVFLVIGAFLALVLVGVLVMSIIAVVLAARGLRRGTPSTGAIVLNGLVGFPAVLALYNTLSSFGDPSDDHQLFKYFFTFPTTGIAGICTLVVVLCWRKKSRA
jgi:hypothetical protein